MNAPSRFTILSCLVAFAVCEPTVIANTPSSADVATLDAVLHKTRDRDIAEQLQRDVTNAAQIQFNAPSSAVSERIQASLSQSLDPISTRKAVEDNLLGELDADTIRQLDATLQDERFAHLYGLQAYATISGLSGFRNQHNPGTLSDARRALIERLDSLLGASDEAIATQREVNTAFGAASEGKCVQLGDSVGARSKAPSNERDTRSTARDLLAIEYRDASDDDLAYLIQRLESADFKSFTHIQAATVRRLLAQAYADAGAILHPVDGASRAGTSHRSCATRTIQSPYDEVVVKSGILDTLDGLVSVSLSAGDFAAPPKDARYRGNVSQAVAKALDIDELRSQLAASLTSLSTTDMRNAIDAVNDPLFQRGVVASRIRAASSQSEPRVTEARRKLLERIASTLGDVSVQQHALSSYLDSVYADCAFSDAELAGIAGRSGKISSALRQATMADLAYAYRDFSDAELDRLAHMQQLPGLQLLHSASQSLFDEKLISQLSAAGGELSSYLRNYATSAHQDMKPIEAAHFECSRIKTAMYSASQLADSPKASASTTTTTASATKTHLNRGSIGSDRRSCLSLTDEKKIAACAGG